MKKELKTKKFGKINLGDRFRESDIYSRGVFQYQGSTQGYQYFESVEGPGCKYIHELEIDVVFKERVER